MQSSASNGQRPFAGKEIVPPYRILTVDDEEEFRDMTAKQLNKRDFECECAPDGACERWRAQQKKIELIRISRNRVHPF